MSDEPGTQVELAEAGEFALYNPDNDFRKLALDAAYISEGLRLVDKDDLVGVPFVVKKIVFRPGFPRDGVEGDYVSVECIIADKRTLDSPPVVSMLPTPLTVYGNEGVVFNDSGTGVRRALVRQMVQFGLAELPGKVVDDSFFDKPYQMWSAGAGPAEAGLTGDDFGGKAAIYLALRGLRRSDYEWHGQDATTYYFG